MARVFDKPNLLIIQTDQQSSWTLSCYGGTAIDTPNIDFLAREGGRFENFFTCSAVCTPSRGCFITGRYPHCNGAYKNDIPLNNDEVTLAHILKENGYETGYAGKWHLNGGDHPGWMTIENSMGFDDCRYMFNCGHYKEAIEHDDGYIEFTHNVGNQKTYMTDWLVHKTVKFLEKSHHKPFFYMLSIPDPHQPFNVRFPFNEMFNPDDMTVPYSFNEKKLPDWAEEDRYGRKICFPLDSPNREEEFKCIKAQYCGEVKCIDENVGKILRCLKKQQLLQNTIVVFVTDHGEYMGEHGLMYKNQLYETVYHIPLIIYWPEQIRGGTVVNEFVSIVDFLPTILGVMGIETCRQMQGRDASPLLRGKKIAWIDEVFIHPNDIPRAGIFTPEYELAYVGKGWEEDEEFYEHILFDRVNDTYQINNLFNDPAYKDVIDELTARIIEHHKQMGTNPDILPEVLKEKW